MIGLTCAGQPITVARVVLLAAWLAGCAAFAARAAEHAEPRKFGDMVGLVVKFSQGQPESDLPTLNDLGVRWVRDHVAWGEVEPSAGHFVDFSPAFKRRLDFYRRHNIGLVALLTLGNPRAYPPTASEPTRSYDAQAFGRFAATVARMLCAEGIHFVLEIGNEPHNSRMAKLMGGAWNGRLPSPWVDHYVRMTAAAVHQVKSFDASVKLLTDDDMWIVHYWFLEAGLPREIDGFAIHPYTGGGIPERTAVAHDTDWTRPFVVVDPDRSFGSAVRRLRAQGQAKLSKPPEIWITEWGWAVGGNVAAYEVPDQTLAAYLPRAFVVAAAAGIEVMCWFSSQDSVDGPMGLIANDGTRRLSYKAFKTMSAQLGEYVYVRQVAGQQRPTTGLQAFLFQGQHDRKLVVWRADGRHRDLPLPRSEPGATATDALGNTVAAEPSASGQAGIEVGAAPIYLTGTWTDAALDASLAAAD